MSKFTLATLLIIIAWCALYLLSASGLTYSRFLSEWPAWNVVLAIVVGTLVAVGYSFVSKKNDS